MCIPGQHSLLQVSTIYSGSLYKNSHKQPVQTCPRSCYDQRSLGIAFTHAQTVHGTGDRRQRQANCTCGDILLRHTHHHLSRGSSHECLKIMVLQAFNSVSLLASSFLSAAFTRRSGDSHDPLRGMQTVLVKEQQYHRKLQFRYPTGI